MFKINFTDIRFLIFLLFTILFSSTDASAQKKNGSYFFVNVNGFYDDINDKIFYSNFNDFEKLPSHLAFTSFSLEYIKRYDIKGEDSVDKIKSYKLTYLQNTSTNKELIVYDDGFTSLAGFDNSLFELSMEYKTGKRFDSNFFYMINGMVYFSRYKVKPYQTNFFGKESTRIGSNIGFEGGYQFSLFDKTDIKFSINYNPVGLYYEIFRNKNPNLNVLRETNRNSLKFNFLQRRIMFTMGISLFQSSKKTRRRKRR